MKRIPLFLALLFLATTALAATRVRVTDRDGLPLPGVTVPAPSVVTVTL